MLIFLNLVFSQQTASLSVALCEKISSQRNGGKRCVGFFFLMQCQDCGMKLGALSVWGHFWNIPFQGYFSWQMSGELYSADGNTAVFIFSSGSVCVCKGWECSVWVCVNFVFWGVGVGGCICFSCTWNKFFYKGIQDIFRLTGASQFPSYVDL